MASTHKAAILKKKNTPFVVEQRPTPAPGPKELLIEIKSIALNPIDYLQRSMGFPKINYPAILGSDIAGVVVAVGDAVSSDAPKVGQRVVAYAPSFFVQGKADYGALQEKALVPAENAVAIPDSMSFNDASVMPMAVQTAWGGWRNIGVSFDTKHTPADKMGVLVWGAGGSVGTGALQTAKHMGFYVYATASARQHEHLKSLGAHRMFDYKDKDVTAQIIAAAKEDGVTIDTAYIGVGDYRPSLEILKALKGSGAAKVASAPFSFGMLWWKLFPHWRSTELKFVTPPEGEAAQREFFHFVFGVYLKQALPSGEYKPATKVRVVPGGLEAAETAVFEFKQGVSGVKLVLEV